MLWFVIRVPKKSLEDHILLMKCQSEFEVSLKLIESLYLKIDPCLDKEILVTLIAVYHKGM